MRLTLPLFVLSLFCAGLTSCSQNQQQEEESASQAKEEVAPAPLYLGSIHQVFPADNFVLIRIIGPRPTEGTVLITHPSDGSTNRMGNLVVSSSQHEGSRIIAADIRSGQIAKGDRVFKYRAIASAPEEKKKEEDTSDIFTTDADKLDVGYIPPEVIARRKQREAIKKQQAADAAQDFIVPTEEPNIPPAPDEEPDSSPAMPDIPVPAGLPRLEDVPDTINGWDSM